MVRRVWMALLAVGVVATGESCVTGEGFACEGTYSCPSGMACIDRFCALSDTVAGNVADSGNGNMADSGRGIACGYDSNPCPTGQICNLMSTCAAPQYAEANGVVTDGVTGLKWQQSTPSDACPNDGAGVCTWQDAQTYCASLTLRGTGWSLPTVQQLFSLVDVGQDPAFDSTAFPGAGDEAYWSSTLEGVGDAWDVFTYGGGGVGSTSTNNLGSVMCVR